MAKTPQTQTDSATTSHPSSAKRVASQKESEQLRQELAAFKSQQEQQKQTISNDTKLPTITLFCPSTPSSAMTVLSCTRPRITPCAPVVVALAKVMVGGPALRNA